MSTLRSDGRSGTGEDDVELAKRIGLAWRDLRRGASMGVFLGLLYGETGLDLGQMDTLEHLSQVDGQRMSELAEAMRVDASTATRAVQRLVDAGYAERAPHPVDARCVMVRATPAGRVRHEELTASRRASMVEMISDIPLDTRRHLADGMEALLAALDAFVVKRTAEVAS
jgi:DNA-binding MarR family transcriptional regulator